MEVRNIAEFLTALTEIKKLNGSQHLFFRGHSNEKYDLKPNLYRKENYYVDEDNIFKETIINSPHEFKDCKTTIEVLVKMQHYGIPTRLLDITRNPLVALYFSCVGNTSYNGEVITMNIPTRYVRFYDSDKVTILANIAKQQVDFGFDYKEDFDYDKEEDVDEVNSEYFGYLLHSIKDDKPHFYDIIDPRDLEKVIAVQVKLDNPRIIKQSGAFLIFGIKKGCEQGKTEPAELEDSWILKPKGERLIVPKDCKEYIIKELDLLGINSSTLFPELEDLGKYLREKYGKKQ